MEKITLDFSNCKRWYDVHEELRIKFDFPEWYGKNLDALWDCMICYCNHELVVSIYGTKDQSEENTEVITEILEVFDDVHKEQPNIKFEIIS